MLVDDNNRVRKGDVLVQLDREPYEIQVALKKAAAEIAQADLVATQDRLRGIAAQARSNRFQLEHAMEDVRNQLALLKSNVAQLKAEQARPGPGRARLCARRVAGRQRRDQPAAIRPVQGGARRRQESRAKAPSKPCSKPAPAWACRSITRIRSMCRPIWTRLFPLSGRRWPTCW